MCDKDHFAESVKEYEARGLITRRQFGVLVAAGVAMMLPETADAQATAEREVEIKTPDGTCDAYFVYPASGTGAAVLIWPDIFGLRPAMRTMGKRLAGAGYSVLVVNPFYRTGKPTATGATPIQEMMPHAKALTPATHMTDARAFVTWLDAQPQVNKNRKIGTQGYCMGGPMAFRTAAAAPDRVGAVASFHGGGLVGKEGDATSPHVPARHAGLQRAGRREGVGPSGGAL
jgi:carboxymethylenebutenolidase